MNKDFAIAMIIKRRREKPRSNVQRKARHKSLYGNTNIPKQRGMGLGRNQL